MNCDLAKTEMIAYLKGELNSAATRHLEEHLAQCPSCRRELEHAREVLRWTEAATEEAVITLVYDLLKDGIRAGASDIHVEPQRDDSLLVRHRVDGVLHEVNRIEPVNRRGVMARMKMLADMNIGETRIPQDGRIPITLDGRDFDFRVNVCPSMYGEDAVFRILDRSNVLMGLEKLGFHDEQLAAIHHMIEQPSGLVIVTGPTGSGKTTTLYSMLDHLSSPALEIMTIEDPIEYKISGVMQVQVHKKAGLTFTAAQRSFLRHDPDIIMAGETRDLESALITIESALTGHLMLTTLHTTDAVSALIRLVDMGVEPYLVGATLIGVIGQRLVREVCASCKEEVEVDLGDPVIRFLGITTEDLEGHVIYRGKGCETCRGTGYRGRMGLYEVLTMDRELATLLVDRAPLRQIFDSARSRGFVTMREDAKRKVLEGRTTPEEAFRVLFDAGTPA